MSDALANTNINVKGAHCLVEADWPLIGGAFTVNDIDVLWPNLLLKRLTDSAGEPIDVESIRSRLAAAFPPA